MNRLTVRWLVVLALAFGLGVAIGQSLLARHGTQTPLTVSHAGNPGSVHMSRLVHEPPCMQCAAIRKCDAITNGS